MRIAECQRVLIAGDVRIIGDDIGEDRDPLAVERQGLPCPPGGLHQITKVQVRSSEMILIVGNTGVGRGEIAPRRDPLLQRFACANRIPDDTILVPQVLIRTGESLLVFGDVGMFRDQGTESFGGLAVSVGNLWRESRVSECVAQIDLAIAQHILIIGTSGYRATSSRFNRHRLLDDGRRFVEVSRPPSASLRPV